MISFYEVSRGFSRLLSYNPWAIRLAEIKHDQAETLEEIAERVDENDKKRLREIAESFREEAEIKEERYYD